MPSSNLLTKLFDEQSRQPRRNSVATVRPERSSVSTRKCPADSAVEEYLGGNADTGSTPVGQMPLKPAARDLDQRLFDLDIAKKGFLRLPGVLTLFPVSRSTWYAGVASGIYPAPVSIGKRAKAWRIADIDRLLDGK